MQKKFVSLLKYLLHKSNYILGKYCCLKSLKKQYTALSWSEFCLFIKNILSFHTSVSIRQNVLPSLKFVVIIQKEKMPYSRVYAVYFVQEYLITVEWMKIFSYNEYFIHDIKIKPIIFYRIAYTWNISVWFHLIYNLFLWYLKYY